MTPPTEPKLPEEIGTKSHLKKIRLSGNVTIWYLIGVIFSVLGIFVTTSLSTTIWMFLLYPLFIGILLLSLNGLALQLMKRF